MGWPYRHLATAFIYLMVTPGFAHDMWLEPAEYQSPEEKSVPVAILIGDHAQGEPYPRNPARIERFALIDADGNESPVAGRRGRHPAGSLQLIEPGSYAVVYVSDASSIEMEAREFESYLREEGLDAVISQRDAAGAAGSPGRERYSRSLKTLLSTPGVAIQDRTTGIPLEFLLTTVKDSDEEFAVDARLSFRGAPLANALVAIYRLDEPQAPPIELRTGDDGSFAVSLPSGRWMMATTHMIVDDSPTADWRSYWSTLTFALDP